MIFYVGNEKGQGKRLDKYQCPAAVSGSDKRLAILIPLWNTEIVLLNNTNEITSCMGVIQGLKDSQNPNLLQKKISRNP